MSRWLPLAAVALLLVLSAAPGIAAEVDATGLARSISELGPRVPGTSAHASAVEALAAALREAGLDEVEILRYPGDPELRLVTGLLPGETDSEILLSAHFDTVAGSPGAADNAAGCAAVVAAAALLEEIPRRHSVRVLLFDGEEAGQLGSTAWAKALEADHEARILAAINVDLIGWDEQRRGTILPLLPMVGVEPRVAPAWLVHAVVASSRAVGAPLTVAAAMGSPIAQLLLRSVRLRVSSDAEALLAHGIPAVTLSDFDAFSGDPENHGPGDQGSRLDPVAMDRWVTRLSAAVRRLDVLEGRPRDDDQFLAAFGRVWSRRQLYWLGLTVWVLLVFRGLPGRWRATATEERRRRGRSYLPGFVLRLLLLACILMLPVFAIVLLIPGALVSVPPDKWSPGPRVAIAIAVVPTLLTLVGLAAMTMRGLVAGLALSPVAALLLGGCLMAQLAWISRSR